MRAARGDLKLADDNIETKLVKTSHVASYLSHVAPSRIAYLPHPYSFLKAGETATATDNAEEEEGESERNGLG